MNKMKKEDMDAERKTRPERLHGGTNAKDDVRGSGVYPVSEMKGAAPDAKVRGERSFGQGERGAEGYDDAGDSGVIILDNGIDDSKKRK